MTKPNVLVIEDNAAVRDLIRESLEDNGYVVFTASRGDEALRILRVKGTDAILLDLNLPDANGLNLIAGIRESTDAPVIVVSGKGSLVDKVVGLEMGADDYLAKPFEVTELLARVKANVRRYQGKTGGAKKESAARPRVKFGDITLDPNKFQAFRANGKSCNLTAMEFRLLEALAEAPNRVLSREQLLEKARAADALHINDRAIDIQVARIRRKIGDDVKEGQLIQTVRGAGYMLACAAVPLPD
jgi:two-component system phosphate regulon response regulator OmpR